MNSRETLTCNLFQLPQDIFRIIFQYLSVYDLMEGEQAFLNNQELLSLYRSSLEGFTLKEIFTLEDEDDKLISWILDRKLLVETLDLYYSRDLEMNLLNQIRFSLNEITFNSHFSDHVIPPLGHFPSLTSVRFEDSPYFTNDQLLSFFSHNPQLEIVEIEYMSHLSNEFLPHLSNSCPKIKILSFPDEWVNDETMSLLTQQRLPHLKSLDIRCTEVTNQESLRQFILSHPLLSSLFLPNNIQYSYDFLLFYLRQVIFPSILNRNNNNDLESHSLAISSLVDCFCEDIFNERNDVVNPEIFSVDILSHLYHKDGPVETLSHSTQIFYHLSKFPSMVDSILQSQFIPILLDSPTPHHFLFPGYLGDVLIRCGVLLDYCPLLVEKYRTDPEPLIEIFHQVVEYHFTSLTTEDLQTIIPIVLNKLQDNYSTYTCLKIISKILQEPSSQLLVDPNNLLSSLKSIDFVLNCNIDGMIKCLGIFISVNENYRQLFIESNLFPQIMKVMDPSSLIDFTKHCLLSRYELLVDHFVDSGLFQYLLSEYSQFTARYKKKMDTIFKQLIEFKNNKYSEIVKEMKLPNELKSKLFEKEKTKKRTNKMRR